MSSDATRWCVTGSGKWKEERGYQTEALALLSEHDRSIIVAPPGSGKSYIGIKASLNAGFRILMITWSAEACLQLKADIVENTNVDASFVRIFNSKRRDDPFRGAGILIITYWLIAMKDFKRAADTNRIFDFINRTKFHAVFMDEMHCAEAKCVRPNLQRIIMSAHKVIAMTATLIREGHGGPNEEEKIEELFSWVAPLRYKIPWKTLENDGYIAKLNIAEINCDMGSEFEAAYSFTDKQTRRYVAVLPPPKVQAVKAMADMLSSAGKQVIVFADHGYSCSVLSEALGCPVLDGEKTWNERLDLVSRIKKRDLMLVVATRVADLALDLPVDAVLNVDRKGISRVQSAQRIGRALRTPQVKRKAHYTERKFLKKRLKCQKSCFVVTFVTKNTKEVEWAAHARKFINSEGYDVPVFEAAGIIDDAKTIGFEVGFEDTGERLKLLEKCLAWQHESVVKSAESDAAAVAVKENRENDKKRATLIEGIQDKRFKQRAKQRFKAGKEARARRDANSATVAAAKRRASFEAPQKVKDVLDAVRNACGEASVEVEGARTHA